MADYKKGIFSCFIAFLLTKENARWCFDCVANFDKAEKSFLRESELNMEKQI